MNWMDWIKIIISILSGIVVCIPLCVKLYNAVEELVINKNWNKLVYEVLQFMVDAEENFDSGTDRKTYVMNAAEYVAGNIGYEWNDEIKNKLSDFIDAVCTASKYINVTTIKPTVKE